MKNKCIICKKEIKHYNKNAKYCSRKCYNKKIWTKKQDGENNKQWMGEVISKMELTRLYQTEQQSIGSIAKKLEVSNNVILRRLIKYGILPRSYHEQKKVDSLLGRNIKAHEKEVIIGSPTWNRRNYLNKAKKNFIWKCNRCEKKETNPKMDLVVHHKDKNNKNSDNINNLEVLCQSCHIKEHKPRLKMKNETNKNK